MLTDARTDGRTDGWTDDGRKVITIAHPEQSSGELKNECLEKKKTDFFNSDDVFFKIQVLIQTFHRSVHILTTVG